ILLTWLNGGVIAKAFPFLVGFGKYSTTVTGFDKSLAIFLAELFLQSYVATYVITAAFIYLFTVYKLQLGKHALGRLKDWRDKVREIIINIAVPVISFIGVFFYLEVTLPYAVPILSAVAIFGAIRASAKIKGVDKFGSAVVSGSFRRLMDVDVINTSREKFMEEIRYALQDLSGEQLRILDLRGSDIETPKELSIKKHKRTQRNIERINRVDEALLARLVNRICPGDTPDQQQETVQGLMNNDQGRKYMFLHMLLLDERLRAEGVVGEYEVLDRVAVQAYPMGDLLSLARVHLCGRDPRSLRAEDVRKFERLTRIITPKEKSHQEYMDRVLTEQAIDDESFNCLFPELTRFRVAAMDDRQLLRALNINTGLSENDQKQQVLRTMTEALTRKSTVKRLSYAARQRLMRTMMYDKNISARDLIQHFRSDISDYNLRRVFHRRLFKKAEKEDDKDKKKELNEKSDTLKRRIPREEVIRKLEEDVYLEGAVGALSDFFGEVSADGKRRLAEIFFHRLFILDKLKDAANAADKANMPDNMNISDQALDILYRLTGGRTDFTAEVDFDKRKRQREEKVQHINGLSDQELSNAVHAYFVKLTEKDKKTLSEILCIDVLTAGKITEMLTRPVGKYYYTQFHGCIKSRLTRAMGSGLNEDQAVASLFELLGNEAPELLRELYCNIMIEEDAAAIPDDVNVMRARVYDRIMKRGIISMIDEMPDAEMIEQMLITKDDVNEDGTPGDIRPLTKQEIRDRLTYEEEQDLDVYPILPTYSIWVTVFGEEDVLGFLLKSLLQFHYPKLHIVIAGEQTDKGTWSGFEQGKRWGEMPSWLEYIGGPPRAPNRPGEPVQTYTKPLANTYAAAFTQGPFGEILDGEDRPEEDQARKAVTTYFTMKILIEDMQRRMGKVDDDQGEVQETEPDWDAIAPEVLEEQYIDIAGQEKNMWLECMRFNIKVRAKAADRARRNFEEVLERAIEVLNKNNGDWRCLNSESLRMMDDMELYTVMEGDDIDRVVKFLTTHVSVKDRSQEEKIRIFQAMMRFREFERISRPAGGQGRLAHSINATYSLGAIGHYAEYKQWYKHGWDGTWAGQDWFKPLGGTTGIFMTRDAMLAGAWDANQIAEDYMLGFVMWMMDYNVVSYDTITPEDPVTEMNYLIRVFQVTRWLVGYHEGLIFLANEWTPFHENSNMKKLIKKKGRGGLLTHLHATLSSSILPLIAYMAITVTILCSFVVIFYYASFIFATGSVAQLFLSAMSSDLSYLMNVSFGWIAKQHAWVAGFLIFIIPFILHPYYSVSAIFAKGQEDRVELDSEIAEQEQKLKKIEEALAVTDEALLAWYEGDEDNEGRKEGGRNVASIPGRFMTRRMQLGEYFKKLSPEKREKLIRKDAAELRKRLEMMHEEQIRALNMLKEGKIGFMPFVYVGIFSTVVSILTVAVTYAFAPWNVIAILAAVSWLFAFFVWGSKVWQLYRTKEIHKKRILARDIRVASGAMLESLYHMFYVIGCVHAWKRIMVGAYVFWGKTMHVGQDIRIMLASRRYSVTGRWWAYLKTSWAFKWDKERYAGRSIKVFWHWVTFAIIGVFISIFGFMTLQLVRDSVQKIEEWRQKILITAPGHTKDMKNQTYRKVYLLRDLKRRLDDPSERTIDLFVYGSNMLDHSATWAREELMRRGNLSKPIFDRSKDAEELEKLKKALEELLRSLDDEHNPITGSFEDIVFEDHKHKDDTWLSRRIQGEIEEIHKLMKQVNEPGVTASRAAETLRRAEVLWEVARAEMRAYERVLRFRKDIQLDNGMYVRDLIDIKIEELRQDVLKQFENAGFTIDAQGHIVSMREAGYREVRLNEGTKTPGMGDIATTRVGDEEITSISIDLDARGAASTEEDFRVKSEGSVIHYRARTASVEVR
ncbi:MAG: hypothetical protein WBC99_06750, partial [Candidatus Omnitrophota bacterium]